MTINSLVKTSIPLLATMFFYASSFSSTVYTKETELLPIKLSDIELQRETDKISNLIKSANASAIIGRHREYLTFVSGKTKVVISGHRFLSSEVGIPKASYGFGYDYSSGTDEAPITSVSLDFGDYYRKIRVTGNSPDQVDAIFSTIESDLSGYSTLLGGSTIRVIVRIFLFYIFALGFIGGSISCLKKRSARHIGIPIFSAIGIILLLTLPFKDLLAGFAMYQGEASFIVRYGYQISFTSFLVTLLAIPLSYYLPLILSKTKHK